ncbi:MAG: cytidine deaminase [Bacilli bacterium]|jgi:cytidine deaminase|nr:cytidine deaminase [Acholeplasmataceae bacterium]
MKIDYDKIYISASQARENAYAPYSRFSVGAAVLLRDGRIVAGANVENASYPLAICAERAALTAAYGAGARKEDIAAIGVVGATDLPISPCGACRQVIAELMDADAEVILYNLKKEKKIFRVKDLLPYPFEAGVLSDER